MVFDESSALQLFFAAEFLFLNGPGKETGGVRVTADREWGV